MTFKMVKRPYAARRIHPVVMDEVANAYKVLGKAAAATLAEDVQDWSEKPEFKFDVKVTKKRWTFILKYDHRTRGGKKYTWVNEGTGSYNPDTPTDEYEIKPKKADGFLAYKLPSMTKSMPASGIPSKSSQAPQGTVISKGVMHPGIDPRYFDKELKELLKSRKPGSVHNVTEAAIKRGLRRMGIPT